MGKIVTRLGALIIAFLFLITSLGFSFLVIWQIHQQNKAKPTTSASQQPACGSSQPAGSIEKIPLVFKPAGPVTKLEITDIKPGNGQPAKAGDCLQMKYNGSLVNGKVFDGNFNKPTLFEFQLGAGQVIAGWDQGLIGLKVGGERRLVIPASLGYGKQSAGSIPANSALVFDVQLVKIGQ